MAPKKDKEKKVSERVGIFNEVERTFLEQQVVECNRKNACLRSSLHEYETRNEELQSAYEKLDEDRADIIAYLKKQLNIKTEEYNELKEKIDSFIQVRDTENTQFRETVTELKNNFTAMKDQLTSENKLLTGKLNTLEEFRFSKDDLMQKFNLQEQDYADQEMKYKRIIYNAEKKFVIGKDKLKKEMEARLLQLAQDFQDATEIRIAASTHRVIRENIAISNELDNILTTQQKVTDQNKMYKEDIIAATFAKELAEEERDKAINKTIVQLKVIDRLTVAFEKLKRQKGIIERHNYDLKALQVKIQKLTKDNENLSLQVRILEQKLHVKLSENNKAIVDTSKIIKERDKLLKTLQNAAFVIQSALKLDQWAHVEPEREAMDRDTLLTNLLQIVTQFREIQTSESLPTVASFSQIYNEGDLGFIPKSVSEKKLSRSSDHSIAIIAGQVQKQPTDVFRLESKTILITTPLSSFSLNSSIQTIPNIKVLPDISSPKILETKASLESFVSSVQSTVLDEQEIDYDEGGVTDIEQKLLASKLEIQKSILKDLASSRDMLKSTLSLIRKPSELIVARRASVMSSRKSVTIQEDGPKVEELNLSEYDVSPLIPLEQIPSDVTTEGQGSTEGSEVKTERLSETKTTEFEIKKPPE